MLPEVNIWMDVIGWVVIIGAIAFFLGVHFPANVIAGRVKERFVDKHWWYLEALHEPLPDEYVNIVLQRTWHWINLISFITFFVTGFLIRYPFFIGREMMRNFHLIAAYINIVNFSIRLLWTILSKDRKNFTFDRSDIKTLIENGKYYLFLSKSYPHEKKFHPIQRATYIMMALLFSIMIYTGASILWPGVFINFISASFGGEAAAVAWIRITHSAVARIFFLVMFAHAYLGIMETWPTLKYFWFGIKPPDSVYKFNEHGHGDHEKTEHGSVVDEEHVTNDETNAEDNGESQAYEPRTRSKKKNKGITDES